MYCNVIISFFIFEGIECVFGKVCVENGIVVFVFFQYDDNIYELLDKKFYNVKKMVFGIINGILEMIFMVDGEKFCVVFIEKFKFK